MYMWLVFDVVYNITSLYNVLFLNMDTRIPFIAIKMLNSSYLKYVMAKILESLAHIYFQ